MNITIVTPTPYTRVNPGQTSGHESRALLGTHGVNYAG